MQTAHYKSLNGIRAVRRWAIPYFNSLLHSRRFRPILCYLFTEWRCNIDCHYCFQYDNSKRHGAPSMDLDTAKGAVDWLKSLGCRVIPLMGGEPTLRKDFVLELVRYGAEKGYFMYLPTNGYLLDKPFIDELGRSGVAAVNLAVDCIGNPKFDQEALKQVKEKCLVNCSSTCYHTMATYYSMRRLPQWIRKHVRIG